MSQQNESVLQAPLNVVFITTPADWAFRVESDDPNEATFRGRANFKYQHKKLDPWKIREEFFFIKSTNHLLFFLEKTGLFSRPTDDFADLQEWKSLFKLLMRTNPVSWPQLKGGFAKSKLELVLRSRLPQFEIMWSRDRHKVVLTTVSTLTAILASIQIDHLRGVKYVFCRREDCGKPYRFRSNKLFCNYDCAHLHTVRRLRAEERRRRKR